MSGLMFPKPKKKKMQKVIRKKQKQKRQITDGLMYSKGPWKNKKRERECDESILHCKDGTCYLCVKLKRIYYRYPTVHKHHVYPGRGRREVSENNGFYVYLCPRHHEYHKEAVHENSEHMLMIKRDCQREYEKTHTRQQFMELIEQNYLEGEDDSEV